MRRFSLLATTVVAVAALTATTAAQGRGTSKTPTTKAPTAGASASKGGAPSTHGASGAKAGGTTTKTSGSAHGSAHSGSTKHTKTASTSTGTSASTTTANTGTTTTPPPTFEPNAISTKISKNPNQLAKVKTMLPTGMSIEEASAGFRNQGQFIAALNVSKNQNIDFVQLKDAMTIDGLSLGQAAKQVRTAPPETPDTGTPGGGSTGGGSTTTGGSTTGGSTTGGTKSSTTTAPAAK